MERICGLDRVNIGQKAEIVELKNKGSIRRRLIDLGFYKGCKIECVLKSPFNDPCAYLVKGAVIAVRKSDSKNIVVRCVND